MGMTVACLSWTLFEKMTWGHCMFERMEDFLTNCGQESSLFFREWTWRFFDEIWAWEQLFFREKSEKMASYWLLRPIYSVVLTELTFLVCLSWTFFEKLHEGTDKSGNYSAFPLFLFSSSPHRVYVKQLIYRVYAKELIL